MNVRVIQLLNHYPDDSTCSGGDPLGTLCAFGYHDAIEIYTERQVNILSDKMNAQMTLWKMMENITIEKMNGTHTMHLVSGIFEEKLQEKEAKFWKSDEMFPYYFIVMMRIAGDIPGHKIQEQLKIENQRENLVIYKTLEHCEIIAACKTKSYKEGIETVEELRNNFGAQKTYSVFAIEEALLKNKEYWEKRLKNFPERVKVQLNITMKNKQEALMFLNRLGESLAEDDQNVKSKIYDILGEQDLLFDMNNVPLEKILPFYAMGEYMSHSNEHYKKAFYNVESRFILERRI